MEAIRAYFVLASIVAAFIGCGFRLGVEYNEKNRLPVFIKVFFIIFFSFGIASLMYLFVVEREWSVTIKLILICAASFFGSEIVPGLGSVKGGFFAGIFKDALRKYVNGKADNVNNYGNEISESNFTNEISEEVSKTSQDSENLDQ